MTARERLETWRTAVATSAPASGRRRVFVAAASLMSIGVIATVDYATGVQVSLSVFYLIPIAVVTVAVSARAGFLMAAVSALAWTMADTFIAGGQRSVWLQGWNTLLRFATMSVVVALLAALRVAAAEARSSEKRSKDFLAYAAHQLRTPIAALRATSEAVVLSKEASVRDQLLANITVETGRMGRLVAALLRMTRIDQGDPLDLDPTEIVQLVGTEVSRAEAAAPHLLVLLEVVGGAPVVSMVDSVALAEIVANLLDNARRHAETTIAVTVGRMGTNVRIGVTDDGPGLPAGVEDRAFDRFVSLDGLGGSGLGLAIARSLAEAHGGRLWYEARHFMVSLPVTVEDQGSSPRRARARHVAPR